MARVLYTATARADIAGIAEYIGRDNPRAAGSVIAAIRKTCASLGERPALGRLRPDLAENLRSFPVGSYVVFYRISGDTIDIISVLHGARDIANLLGDTDAV